MIKLTKRPNRELRTVELALELGQHQGNGLGGSGGGGDDVKSCGTGAAQVAVAGVQQPLVAGVAVGSGHGALHDAKLLVQHLRVRTAVLETCWVPVLHLCRREGSQGAICRTRFLTSVQHLFKPTRASGNRLDVETAESGWVPRMDFTVPLTVAAL